MTIDLLKRIQKDYNNSRPLVYAGLYLYIVQLGCGGNGGPILQSLVQMLSSSKIPHTYVIADPDDIELKNLKNQPFLEEEIGFKKADVLAERYGAAYNVNISSYSDQYIESAKSMVQLFNMDISHLDGYDSSLRVVTIIIGAVDNHFTRGILNDTYSILKNVIYIDAGNESIIAPTDWRTRPRNRWTEEERELYDTSGWSGQVVCGVKLNGIEYQPAVATVHPEILMDTDDETFKKPSELSCSELAASDPQRMIVNRFASLAVTSYLNEIIESATITNHLTEFHAKRGYMRSYDYVPANK